MKPKPRREYRLNVFQGRCVDYRTNPRAAWRRYPVRYPSTIAALEGLMALRRQAKEAAK